MKKSKNIIPRDKTMVLVAKREISLNTRVKSSKKIYSRKVKHKNNITSAVHQHH